ncbi:MAG: methyl-accepting chemotaxis protein, partial [Pseudanabaenaceae cyanobacterium]
LAQQGAIQVALEGKKVEAEAVRKAYEEAADIQDLSDLSATVALVDIKKSERQFLYARSDGANALASFKEDSKLAAAIEELSKKNVTQTLSRGGSQWVYVPLGDTGWAVVAEAPESAIGGGARQTILLALGLLVGAAGLTAAVFTLDFRSRLQVLLDACSKLEKGVTVPLSSGDEDELGQLQLAVARALQSISLREEELKEQIADVIRQEERQKLREDQEREAEYLESEIGGLLDVVSALEDGDLTVQAEVSDRATGLVADTLNRLRERLAEVIAGVLAVAQKVADGANELQQVARTVSENVENQAQSVVQGRALTEQVAELAKNAAEMVRESSQALATIQATVEQGQGAIQSLTEAIGVLQEGTVKIIQRMKTLGEFVGLAEQFVHDQGQIASLTQVLAINATLVAARAAEQRDPKQFIGVAREFEAIAGQVNTLATQTNDGLGVLQQRTAQIQSVVSAIDAEVQGLGRLVEGFTKGVDKSQKAFNDV